MSADEFGDLRPSSTTVGKHKGRGLWVDEAFVNSWHAHHQGVAADRNRVAKGFTGQTPRGSQLGHLAYPLWVRLAGNDKEQRRYQKKYEWKPGTSGVHRHSVGLDRG